MKFGESTWMENRLFTDSYNRATIKLWSCFNRRISVCLFILVIRREKLRRFCIKHILRLIEDLTWDRIVPSNIRRDQFLLRVYSFTNFGCLDDCWLSLSDQAMQSNKELKLSNVHGSYSASYINLIFIKSNAKLYDIFNTYART